MYTGHSPSSRDMATILAQVICLKVYLKVKSVRLFIGTVINVGIL